VHRPTLTGRRQRGPPLPEPPPPPAATLLAHPPSKAHKVAAGIHQLYQVACMQAARRLIPHLRVLGVPLFKPLLKKQQQSNPCPWQAAEEHRRRRRAGATRTSGSWECLFKLLLAKFWWALLPCLACAAAASKACTHKQRQQCSAHGCGGRCQQPLQPNSSKRLHVWQGSRPAAVKQAHALRPEARQLSHKTLHRLYHSLSASRDHNQAKFRGKQAKNSRTPYKGPAAALQTRGHQP